MSPIKYSVLDADDMRQFRTKEFEKDEISGNPIPVRGSIIGTTFDNLYEYCMDGIRSGRFIDRTARVMPFPAIRKLEIPASLERATSSTARQTPPKTAPKPSLQNDNAEQELLKASFGTPSPTLALAGNCLSICDEALKKDILRALQSHALAASKSRAGVAAAAPKAKTDARQILFLEREKPAALIVGGRFLPKKQMEAMLPAALIERLSAFAKVVRREDSDDIDTIIHQYCHLRLSSLEALNVLQQSTIDISPPNAKEALLQLPDYADGNISLFQADFAAVQRLREVFTPILPHTPALEESERECVNTDEIRKLASQNQQVPQRLINEGDSASCEAVKNYYTALMGFHRIGATYIVTKKYREGEQPEILGVVSIKSPDRQAYVYSDYLRTAFAAPIAAATLTAKELAALPTKEFAQDSGGATKAVRGSIERTSATTMLEYLTQYLTKAPHNLADQITNIRKRDFSKVAAYSLRQTLRNEIVGKIPKK